MKQVLFAVTWMACAWAQFVTPVPAVMPSWMVPYPGAVAQNRQMGNTAESTYTAAAPARDVLAHYRSLFASASQPFQPSAMGYGFLVRASAPECDLSISIERFEPNTNVKVTCSPRLAATQQILDQHAQARARRAQSDPMKTFDSPVYPDKKGPAAPLAWPSWLVRVDGAKLDVERLQGQLRSSFVSQPTREAIQAFYAGLLSAHGYRVKQGLAAVPQQFGSWLVGTEAIEGEPLRRVIHIDIKPAGQNFAVELSLQ